MRSDSSGKDPLALRRGAKAGECLEGWEGSGGEILASLSRAIFLRGETGELIWLAPSHTAMHRRCLAVDVLPGSLQPGERFEVERGWLRMGMDTAIRWAGATDWEPPPLEGAAPVSPTEVGRRVGELDRLLRGWGGRPGLGPVISWVSGIIHGGGLEPVALDTLLEEAKPSIMRVVAACRNRSAELLARAGRELVGLGPGLTPAGDDYLGGVLFGACAAAGGGAGAGVEQKQAFGELTGWANGKTHPISHTIMSDLARGEGPEPLHRVTNWLLRGGAQGGATLPLGRLLAVGHSTGWDMLAGVVTAMLMVTEKRDFLRQRTRREGPEAA